MGTGTLKDKQVRGREKAEREDMGREEKERGKDKKRKRGKRGGGIECEERGRGERMNFSQTRKLHNRNKYLMGDKRKHQGH